jgi:hypothetical protein
MLMRKALLFLSVAIVLFACFKPISEPRDPSVYNPAIKVWGYKPVYSTETLAKTIAYIPAVEPVIREGNIYAFGNYIFQIDPGAGIHVIDNTTPASAKRIGFIRVRGCSQMSIKGDKLYTNSYNDLVIIDFTDLSNVHEHSRVKNIFPEFREYSPIAFPPDKGWYKCPSMDSLVIGWVMDSIPQQCHYH